MLGFHSSREASWFKFAQDFPSFNTESPTSEVTLQCRQTGIEGHSR